MKNIFKYVVLIFSLLFLLSCSKEDDELGFKADFSFEFTDDNHVLFTNNSTGEYSSLAWNFGNGRSESTIDKNETFEVYYPVAGEFTAVLNLLNDEGKSSRITKNISISEDDLMVSFTATPDAENPNLIQLSNTTTAVYDSVKWLYRYKTIKSEESLTAYFPFSGTFTVELQVSKESYTFSKKETVIISDNDPDYISNLTLVWADEFDGTSVNLDNWTFETGASGWGNNELENYTNGDNSEIVDGKLVITAKKVDDYKNTGSYTSSRMITLDKHEFLYGRMEVRAKLPSGTGIWPAIWMLGTNINTVSWPACGEIDIMEYVGYQPNMVHATVHTPSGSGSNGSGTSYTLQSCEEEFHNYGIIWTENAIQFYVDSPEQITYTYSPATKYDTNWPFDNPQFFILNVAVGGNWGGAQGIDNSIFPQKMEVDYVRVYQEMY